LLQTLVRETTNYYQLTHGEELEQVEIPVEEFETRAHELDIHEVFSFYKSDAFKDSGFLVVTNKKQKFIKKVFTH